MKKIINAIWNFLTRVNPVLIALFFISMMVMLMLHDNYGSLGFLVSACILGIYPVVTAIRMFGAAIVSLIKNLFKKS